MKNKILKEVRGRGKTKRAKIVGAKLNTEEVDVVHGLAARFAGGSTAKWARVAMLKFRPSKEDFE